MACEEDGETNLPDSGSKPGLHRSSQPMTFNVTSVTTRYVLPLGLLLVVGGLFMQSQQQKRNAKLVVTYAGTESHQSSPAHDVIISFGVYNPSTARVQILGAAELCRQSVCIKCDGLPLMVEPVGHGSFQVHVSMPSVGRNAFDVAEKLVLYTDAPEQQEVAIEIDRSMIPEESTNASAL